MKFFFVVLGTMIVAAVVLSYFIDIEHVKAMDFDIDDHLGWR